MNEAPSHATDYVAAWITAHRSEIGGTQLKIFRQEQHGRTYCAEFETVRYLIQFCAWDHANCLDIQALDKDSGSDAYMVAGDCDGVEGLSERLNAFLHWLGINESNQEA